MEDEVGSERERWLYVSSMVVVEEGRCRREGSLAREAVLGQAMTALALAEVIIRAAVESSTPLNTSLCTARLHTKAEFVFITS